MCCCLSICGFVDDKLVDFVCPASIDIVPLIGGLGWTYEYMDCAMKIHTYMHTYMHTYIQTHIGIYIHTQIRTYIHTYITYIHTLMHTSITDISIHTPFRTAAD